MGKVIHRRGPSFRKGKGKTVAWLHEHATYDGDGCLIWPFSCTPKGHGNFGHNGKQHRAHQYMCRLVHGERPTAKHEVAHSCGRGHDACVHPHHVSWKTRAENQAERNLHRPKVPRLVRYKVTAEQVAEIRALRGKKTLRELADMFGISDGNVSNILAGRTWRSDTRRDRQFTAEEVARIKSLHGSRQGTKLAAEYGVSPATISRIQLGQSFANVS